MYWIEHFDWRVCQVTLCTYQRPSRGGGGGGGGGGDPREIRGHGAGFVDFCCQFLARGGGIGSLLHFCSTNPGERHAGFVTPTTPPPSWKWTSAVFRIDWVWTTINNIRARLISRFGKYIFPFQYFERHGLSSSGYVWDWPSCESRYNKNSYNWIPFKLKLT